MKRIITLTLIIALLVLVVGCKIQPLDKAPAATEEDEEVAEIEEEIAEIEDIDIDAELSELDDLEKDLALI